MIKNKFRLAIFIAFTGVMINAFAVNAFASNLDKQETKDGLVVYSFGYEIFENFIKNPSQEILEQQVNDVIISIFSNIESSDECIKCETIDNKSVKVDKANEGELKIGKLPVYSSLISFSCNKENLKKMLIENDITGDIADVCVLNMPNMAVTIWLTVNQENYFITIDERYDDYSIKNDEDEYVYRLYSYVDYCNKFGIRDGKLFVNGTNITEGNYVKIHYSGAYLPFRAIMENLGVKVEWDAERNVALLFYNDKAYVFNPNEFSLIEEGTTTNMLITPPGGVYYYCNIIDDRIVMNNNAMQSIIRLMEAKININYDNLIVEINQ